MSINDIKFDHFKNIEELIQHLEMWYAEDDYDAYNRFFGLRDVRIMGMIIYQLTNNWNELEEDINNKIKDIKMNFSQVNGNYFNMNYVIDTYEEVLDKMKEIKEKNNGN